MHENRFNEYRIPSGMLIVFLEKALTLIHMETHLDDVSPVFSPFCIKYGPKLKVQGRSQKAESLMTAGSLRPPFDRDGAGTRGLR